MPRQDELANLPNIFTTKEALAKGVHRRDLYVCRDTGQIIELSRGVFRRSNADPISYLDYVAACKRGPRGMICLQSAASFWDLSDELSHTVHFAVAHGDTRPKIAYPPTVVHVFDKTTFVVGTGTVDLASSTSTDFSEQIRITFPERTIVDLFRMNRGVTKELAHGSLRRYLESGNKPSNLLAIARQLDCVEIIRPTLEIMMA